MRLILMDRLTPKRQNFYPLALSRPIFELRCGMTTLAEKLAARARPGSVACFVPPYMADVYRAATAWPVNDAAQLGGDDLLLVDGRVKAAGLAVADGGPSRVVLDADGEVLLARIVRADLARLQAGSIDAILASAKELLPAAADPLPTWNYTWDLVLANPKQLVDDFRAAGRSGIEGRLEEPSAIRGDRADVFVAPGVLVHPMVVLDAEHGPIYLDEGAEIHPFTRIEGPCYVGKKSILLGAKCREGNSIGPMCRVGGEVEESIIHGYSNKYHDGFLGHAYVGQWVNDQQRPQERLHQRLRHPRRSHGGGHRLHQGGLADRRSHEDLDRDVDEHRGLRGGHGPHRDHRQAAAEVRSLVRLVPRRRRDEGFRPAKIVRDGRHGHGPARMPLDPGRRGHVGRNL